jgi:hypothetical protein
VEDLYKVVSIIVIVNWAIIRVSVVAIAHYSIYSSNFYKGEFLTALVRKASKY